MLFDLRSDPFGTYVEFFDRKSGCEHVVCIVAHSIRPHANRAK